MSVRDDDEDQAKLSDFGYIMCKYNCIEKNITLGMC